MADWYPAEIHIGGPIPRVALKKLIAAILTEKPAMEDYCGPPAGEEALRQAFQQGATVSLYDDQARFGQFEHLEGFLVKHHIHFDRHCDAQYEYDGENVYYRGGCRPVTVPAGQSGQPMVHCQTVLEVLDDASLDDRQKLAILRVKVCPPEMAELAPIRFV